ncbi:MAG: ORF6N domain-containing protein [Acidobacteriia bacterium]|nr:ORF6N domain-containing protein [Terriglobia bacterium]
MRKKPSTDLAVAPEELQRMVHVVRGQRVMPDFDLAGLYGVPTSALNQAVQRNADRFPDDFAYQLTQQEFTGLISQIVTSKGGRGGRRKLPWAFTEHGVAMLSSVLRSPAAVRVNIEIMRTFVRLRRTVGTA